MPLSLALSLSAPEGILREMVARHREYTELGNIRICCGTWNVNGGTHFRSIAFKKEKISDWLLDAHKCCQELFPSESSISHHDLSG